MGIERVGKPGAPVAPASPEAIQPPAHVDGASFAEVTAETRSVSPTTGPQSALEQLRAGAIDLNRYLDIKVQEATGSMADLAPAQVDRVRSALRDRLSSDPTLVDLVRKATGVIEIPAPSIED